MIRVLLLVDGLLASGDAALELTLEVAQGLDQCLSGFLDPRVVGCAPSGKNFCSERIGPLPDLYSWLISAFFPLPLNPFSSSECATSPSRNYFQDCRYKIILYPETDFFSERVRKITRERER